MSLRSIDFTCIGRDEDHNIVVFKADIRVFYEISPASGDGWDEPREAASVGFVRAEIAGQPLEDGQLLDWAKAELDYAADGLIDEAAQPPEPDYSDMERTA